MYVLFSKFTLVKCIGQINFYFHFVKKLREIDPNFPIIATGGPTEETVREVIQAGANAVTFTPPTNGEIFKGMMEEYRHRYD